jgi:acetyl-CoA acetyltransferase
MADMSRSVAIVGVAESDEIGKVEGKSSLQHHAEAAYNALEDAGISISEVDGLLSAGSSNLSLAEYMGIEPKFTDSTSVGGSSFIIHIGHAVAAINAGYCEVALVTHGEAGRSARSRAGGNASEPGAQFETPYGFIGAPVQYAMACRRYMHEYGEDRTRQAMAEIAVSTRKWALMNPKSYMKDPMNFDDYHNSRWVAWPFHLFDCCLVTDAGGAYVITTAERARDLAKKPVYVLGAAEGHDHNLISAMPDLTRTWGKFTGPAALERAGVTHSDIDLAMIYDSFTYTVLATLESLGFCGPGEGPEFVAGQRTAPGGDFAMNTNGGGLSYTHSGMYGMFLVLEAVRQLRGECGDRQLDDPKICLINGTGGQLSSTGTTILAVD